MFEQEVHPLFASLLSNIVLSYLGSCLQCFCSFFVILILSFQEPYVANALLPRMCSKWYFGWVTATLWWIQWYTGSPVKNSNVPFGTFLLASAAKNLTASSRFSGTLSTITKNGPIATFRPQTRKWKPSKTTSAKIAWKNASRIAEPRVSDRTVIPISI